MKIVICPDSFKGSATSSEAGEYILKAVKEVFPTAKVTKLLMADGGEGTVEAISQGAFPTYHTATVIGPFGDEVTITYPITHEGTAILEIASASGITLSSRREPLVASSIGFGQLIKLAYEAGAKKIIVGIGGSATNDGGMGMLEGMGAIFYDKSGNILVGNGANLALVDKIDLSNIHYGLKNIPIGVICDVTNPLLGENGATAIYGAQKGVTQELFDILEKGMSNYAKLVSTAVGNNNVEMSGAGAAGGVGFALASVLNAKLSKGIDLVLDSVGFDKHIKDADLIITGEGQLDRQSVEFGKVPSGIVLRSKGVPVLVVAGSIATGGEGILNQGNCSIIAAIDHPMDVKYAVENAPSLIYNAALRGLHLVRMGIIIGNKR